MKNSINKLQNDFSSITKDVEIEENIVGDNNKNKDVKKIKEIADKLDVNKEEVISMNRRLSGKEFSLNAPVGEDGDEWQDWVVDNEMDHELKIAQSDEMEQRKDLLQDSIKVLNERERKILYSRYPTSMLIFRFIIR